MLFMAISFPSLINGMLYSFCRHYSYRKGHDRGHVTQTGGRLVGYLLFPSFFS